MAMTNPVWQGLLRAMLFLVVALLVPTNSIGAERHAGTVLLVDPVTRLVTVEEYGANAVRRTFSVRLSSDATVLASTRNERIVDFDRPFTDTPIQLGQVRTGDFVVVELGAGGQADRLVVTQRSTS